MLENLLNDIDLNSNVSKLRKDIEKYNGDDWRRYISFDENKYKRNIVCRGKYVEIVLICWRGGQYSDIHGHPKMGCLMKVLEGNLIEQIFNKNKTLVKQNHRKTGDISYMEDNEILHKVINKMEDSFTLHIYPLQ